MTTSAPPDLNDPQFLAGDRAGTYRWLRDNAPVFPFGPPAGQAFVLARHADVHKVLRDPTGRTQPVGLEAPAWMPPGPALTRLTANMGQTNPPVHTRLRGVIGPMFTVRQSEHLRGAAAAEVNGELDRILGGNATFDAVADLAARVPRGVLRVLIGMPDEDWDLVNQAQHDFLTIFSPFPLEPSQQARLDEVCQFYFAHFEGLLAAPGQRTPLVQRMLDAEAQGNLTRAEVLSLMHTVLDAGYETSRTSIANAVQLFAARPELLEAIRKDPGLIPGMVEELLRVRPPVEMMPRILGQDFVTDDGTVLPAGTQALCLIGSANSDPRAFDQPELIDPGRPDLGRSMTFGGGLHHCLGAPLARIQLQETLRSVAQRVSRIELTAPAAVTRFASLVFPSLITLPARAVS